MQDFSQKTAVIYDASHDLGPSYVEALLSRGARVIAICSNPEVFTVLQRQTYGETLSIIGIEIWPFPEIGIKSGNSFEQIELPTQIDIAVHNNMLSRHPNIDTIEYADEDWYFTFEHNTHSAFQFSKAVVPRLRHSLRGSLCFVSTTSSFVTIYGDFIKVSAAYEAANSALNRYSQRLAVELGQYGINVNTLCAGNVDKNSIKNMIKTIATANNKSYNQIERELLSRQVIKGYIPVSHVVDQLCHLLSDSSAYLTGQNLIISGGLEIRK